MYKLRKLMIKKMVVKIFISFIIFSIMVMLALYWSKKIEPTIVSLADSKARTMALNVTNKVVNEYFKTLDVTEFIQLVINDENKIISLKTDTLKMNKISSDISLKIQDSLSKVEEEEIILTLGALTGNKILYAVGPKLKIKIKPFGSVNCKFISEFKDAGINQTIHKVSLKVTTKVIVIAPFITKYQEYEYNINIAETVILGDVPSTYYNINGVDGLDKKDTLNMLE